MINFRLGLPYFLANTYVALNSAKNDPKVMALLDPYNIKDTDIDLLLQQYARVQNLDKDQKKFHEEQYKAWRIYNARVTEARENFQEYRTLTNIAFAGEPEESKELVKLCTTAHRKKRVLAWLESTLRFYSRAIEEIESTESDYVLTRFTTVGVTKEKLETAMQFVSDALTAKSNHVRYKGDGEETIRQRDAEANDLSEKMKRFVDIAKLAFKNSPQYLEKLAITKLSDGYKRVPKDKKTDPEEPAEPEEPEEPAEPAVTIVRATEASEQVKGS